MANPGIRWISYERTGRAITELPGAMVSGSISHIMGRSDSVTIKLPVCDRLPPLWQVATQPLRAILAGVVEARGAYYVVWAGWVEKRIFGSGDTIELGLQPAEGWLARNYIEAGEYRGLPYTTIARKIGLNRLAQEFSGHVEEDPGRVGDRTYTNDQDMTCLTGLQNLMSSRAGCEFTTRWSIGERGNLEFTALVSDRLGSSSVRGVLARGEWTRTEDYTDGKGATIFTGTANREGDERYMYTVQAEAYLGAGFLRVERRWSPDTGSKNPDIIQGYVDAAMDTQKDGTNSYAIEVLLEDCIPTRDFEIGDIIDVELRNPNLPEVNTNLRARLLGWVADPDPVSGQILKIKPILQGVTSGY